MNSNDDQHIDNDPGNLTLSKFEAFINALDTQPNAEMLQKAALLSGVLISDKPSISPQIAAMARIQMQAALMNAKPELAMYLAAINDDAIEVGYIEDMRRVYGDEMVNAALDDARTSYRTFYHSLQLRIIAQRLNSDFANIREAFATFGTALSAAIARGFADVQIDQPKNREERRSAKYGTRRKKEGDQLWARRNNPKRRR
jgi:hypothetical protein